MPACTTDNAFTPVWYACFALRLRVRLEQFKQLYGAPRPEASVSIPHFTGCRLCFVVDLVEEHGRFGWFSIFLTNSGTRELSACFTTEWGNPGIRKSMFTSFSIVCSWLDSSWLTTGCTVLSRIVSSPTLKLMLSWQERVWQPSGTFSVFVSTTGYSVFIMCHFSVVSTTGLPRSIVFDSLCEKNVYRSPGNGTFFFHLARFSC